ncbi:methylamine utilization protein [Idiomarina piscisalsi]|uniref:methylamine utilization protein n=1 Tax=Idiomarina piscisalsi TaxID=1096243 RepID=UPI001384808B|nr:methylamine utilization protein [Idiomarina piscisalsi]MTJ02010.1 methylamine utilization protein [Idiomarina piscisalsi]
MRALKCLLVTLVCLLTVMEVNADELTLTIVDAKGSPLPNAVVIVDNAYVTDKAKLKVENKIIDQVDRQFTPFMTVIKAGSEVTFPNSDNIRHHVYSFSKPKPFELKLYANEEKPTLSFNKPGLVTLGCNIHDQMIAHIVITEDETAWITGENGKVTLELNTAVESLLSARIWHPLMSSDLTSAKDVTLDNVNGKTLMLDVVKEQADKEPKSRLEQRFNRTGNL